MSKTYQFSLFRTASGRNLLFRPKVLAQYFADNNTTPIPDEQRRVQLLRDWLSSLEETSAAESTLESRFFQDIMVGVLGYVLYPAQAISSLYPKPSTRVTRIDRTPDALLGVYTATELQFTAALEVKTPGTDLDLPQAREGNETPVEQGFYYGRRILGVRWVIVTDMRVLRLYAVDSLFDYEELDLRTCISSAGEPTAPFRTLYFLLHYDALVAGHEQAPVSLLYAKSAERQLAIRDSFYNVYYAIRKDLYHAIAAAAAQLPRFPTPEGLLEATQRLLDRLLFIYYCEDHPQALIPHDTVKKVTEAARSTPGPSPFKVYDTLKHLFKEVDEGSPPTSGIRVAAYNGELFKDHWIIDHIDLPDTLHDTRYVVEADYGSHRTIQGVWGLHVFDFWSELNEHLLGHIFEESLSDLSPAVGSEDDVLREKIQERKSQGIFYTTFLLSDFIAGSAFRTVLDDRAPVAGESPSAFRESLERRLNALSQLRIFDPACGSGAFLVSAYRELLEEYWRLRSLMQSLSEKRGESTLFDDVQLEEQAALLRNCLFGVDKLPQAVELAKLALWLRAARKGERIVDLGNNIVATDSLDCGGLYAHLGIDPGSFDLVIGNPPWGGEVDPSVRTAALEALELPDEPWDSWELFVILGLRALKEGGRLAVVLPDSILYPAKARLRRLLFDYSVVEKVYLLGPDWFGPAVRMGTVFLQARRGAVDMDAEMLCSVLAGRIRLQVIQGKVPLSQVEAQRSRLVPVRRSLTSPTREIEVFRGTRDDVIIEKLTAGSIALSELCSRARGEEMSKAGLAWLCPSCLSPTTPGSKQKGGGYRSKPCPSCSHRLTEANVSVSTLVQLDRAAEGEYAPFIDGDDISRRYRTVIPSKWLALGVSGWSYKEPGVYTPPKILLRQAGIGLVATLDRTAARCPQSVYIYRVALQYAEEGYANEFVLGALLSRTMTYYVFKRFGEIDAAKAHAKLTHERLATLPIPTINFGDAEERALHMSITESVNLLLSGEAVLGGAEDRAIEMALRQLWGLTTDDGAYINGEFFDVPNSQIVRDLFPEGPPRPDIVLIA